MNAKKIKMYSEGGKSLKAVSSHYGRKGWYAGSAPVRGDYKWKELKRYLTEDPIMVFPY